MIAQIINKYNAENKVFSKMPNVANLARESKNLLGVGMAEKEWSDNPELANKKFLHIGAYKNFLSPNSIILLGRTGTGKTSILQSIQYNVQQGNCTEYTDVILDEFTDLFHELLKQPLDMIESQMMYEMKAIIKVAVNTLVMTYYVKKFPKTELLNKTRSYLSAHGFYHEHKLSALISKLFALKPSTDDDKLSKISYITDIYNLLQRELFSNYDEAQKELMLFMEDKKMVVLFDSLNTYNITQKSEVIAIKALISSCFDFFISNKKTNIHLKIALPSEVHTRILDSLPGKQQGNTALIQWKHKDLVAFAALRIYYWLKENQDSNLDFSFVNNFHESDFYLDNNDSYSKSKQLLSYFFPKTCPTSFMFEFDTIAYCIRHTLKKPREIIAIFNAVIEEIVYEGNIRHFIDNPCKIKNTVHSTQENMIKSALSMYEASFDAINSACSIVLGSTKFIFELSDIRDRLKEAEAQTKNRGHDYDKIEILRILFESGLVGVINEINHIENPPHSFKSDKPFDLIIANFEYQIKGQITVTQDNQYVIHPMCYEYYQCYVDNCSMVYPNRFADEEDIISTILKSE